MHACGARSTRSRAAQRWHGAQDDGLLGVFSVSSADALTGAWSGTGGMVVQDVGRSGMVHTCQRTPHARQLNEGVAGRSLSLCVCVWFALVPSRGVVPVRAVQ